LTLTNRAIFSIEEVITATGGKLISGPSAMSFCGVSTDSRSIVQGNIFIALKGESYDGHDFAVAALQQGAAGLLIQNETDIGFAAGGGNAAVIMVADTLQALGDLASAWRKKFTVPVIALTGSSGKTTTKEMIAGIIGREKNVLKTEGNLNNLIGLPLTLLGLKKEHEIAILEMGTNTRGEIKRLTQIAAPDIALITNIGPAHLAGFGTVEAIREEKGALFLHMAGAGLVVVNVDDEAVRTIAEGWKGRKVTFGMSLDADITAGDIEKNGVKGVRFNLSAGGKTEKVEMKTAGIHNIYNALAAAAVAGAAGCDMATIREGLMSFRPVSGRMTIIKLRNCAFIIDDSYNANPASMREALMTLKDLKNHHNGFVFFGDMLELGDAAAEMHRKIGILMATIGVSAVFLKGEYAAHTSAGAREGGMAEENIFLLSDETQVAEYLKKHLKKGDWILVKGSRRMKMEKITALISETFGVEAPKEKNKTIN